MGIAEDVIKEISALTERPRTATTPGGFVSSDTGDSGGGLASKPQSSSIGDTLRQKGLWFGAAPDPLTPPSGRGKAMAPPYTGMEIGVGNAPQPIDVKTPSTIPAAAVPLTSAPLTVSSTESPVRDTGGGVSPATFTAMQGVGRRAVAQSAFNRGPSGGVNYDVSQTGKNEYTMTPKDRPAEPDSNLGPIEATRDLRAGYLRDAENTQRELYRNRVIDGLDAQIKDLSDTRGPIPPGEKAKMINDLLAKKMELVGRDVQAGSASEGFGVTREGHAAQNASTRESAKERVAQSKATLAETSRYHDILAMGAKDKRDNDKFMREEANRLRDTQGEDALMRTYGGFTDAAGEKSVHPSIAIFKLIDSGYDVGTMSKQWQATANQVREGFRAFALKAKAANPKFTPAQIKAAYYDELRGAK
jgi:hypothetical protein